MISKSWTGKLDLKFLNLFLYWLWSANEIVVNLEKKTEKSSEAERKSNTRVPGVRSPWKMKKFSLNFVSSIPRIDKGQWRERCDRKFAIGEEIDRLIFGEIDTFICSNKRALYIYTYISVKIV